MATHSSIRVWRILWTEETGGLQSMGLQRVRQDWVTEHTPPIHRKDRDRLSRRCPAACFASPPLQPLTYFHELVVLQGHVQWVLIVQQAQAFAAAHEEAGVVHRGEATIVGLVLDVPPHSLPAQPAHRELRVLAGHGEPLSSNVHRVPGHGSFACDSHRAGRESFIGSHCRGVVHRPRMDFQTRPPSFPWLIPAGDKYLLRAPRCPFEFLPLSEEQEWGLPLPATCPPRLLPDRPGVSSLGVLAPVGPAADLSPQGLWFLPPLVSVCVPSLPAAYKHHVPVFIWNYSTVKCSPHQEVWQSSSICLFPKYLLSNFALTTTKVFWSCPSRDHLHN